MASTACNATGDIMSAGKEDCRATPSTFTTQIYEIGLCTAHPYGAAKTSATFDASTCVVIYTDAAPAAVNLAAAIGTNTSSCPELRQRQHRELMVFHILS